MMPYDSVNTEKTINHLRKIADMLESKEIVLTDIYIESRCVDWKHEETEVSIKFFGGTNNG